MRTGLAAWLALGWAWGCGDGGTAADDPLVTGDARPVGDGPSFDARPADAGGDGPMVWTADAADLDARTDDADGPDGAAPDARAPDAFVGCRDDVDCDDGTFCNGAERCAAGRCYASPVGPCEDDVACTREVCDEDADVCRNEPDDGLCPEGSECDRKAGCFRVRRCAADAECDDGLVCNGAEVCLEGRCAPGPAMDCDDAVDCTLDVCVEDTASCEHLPLHRRCIETELCDVVRGCADRPPCQRDDDCDDASFCNGVERCDVGSGVCVPGEPPPVDDAVACTVDVCSDARAAVLHQPSPARCADGLFCNGDEVCHPQRGCEPGEPPVLSDGVACTVDRCDEDLDFVEHTPDDARCDDGLFCNGEEVCHPVEDCRPGEPPALSDGVGCTVDACSEVDRRVVHRPADEACDDDLFCNGRETCDPERDCQPGAPPALDDGVTCTADRCDEASDRVVHDAEDARCDDGNVCNGAETCDGRGGCQPGRAPDLDDGVGCTIDACDPETGRIEHVPNDGACDDRRACNGRETCDPQRGCVAGVAPGLDDGIDCTADRCDDQTGLVVHEPVHARCDDGLFCNGAETCDAQRGCRPGAPPALDDGVGCTADECDEANDRVVHRPDPARCDDRVFCNGAEVCDAARGCQPGPPPRLDDGVACTVDACDEQRQQVTHLPDHARCANGAVCDGEEFCDPARGCQAGAAPPDGTVCAPMPRGICLTGVCGPSICGDRYVDVGAGEECERGDADCGNDCRRTGGGDPTNYSGVYDTNRVAYQCRDAFFGFPVVTIDFAQLSFLSAGGQLTVTAPGSPPPPMTQAPAPNDGNFDVRGTIPGGCSETYRLQGRFTNPERTRWTATFSVTFAGAQCGLSDCTNQSFNVQGTKR